MANYNLSSSFNFAILTDKSGSTLYDSGGPAANYADNENFYVMIAPAYATGTLTLNLTAFKSEAGYDYLRIYSDIPPTSSFSYAGTTTGSYLIAVLNGTVTVPQTITSSTGRAYIRWNSDNSVNDTGFALEWTGSGFYTVDSSSGVTTNKYAVNLPLGATTGSYVAFNSGIFTGSGVLTANKDILFGAWIKSDKNGLNDTNLRGIFGLGSNNGNGITLYRPSGTNYNLGYYYKDISGTFTSTFTDILMGGQGASATYPPQWHQYGFALRKTSTTGAILYAYRDGYLFATSSITNTASWAALSSSSNLLLGAYRTSNIVQSSSNNTWSGSFDDVFMATVTTGSAESVYTNFFASMYNSGNWVDPNSAITASFSEISYAPRVLFNWRFEETGSVLNTKDYGYYGNVHSASSTGSSPALTTTSSGVSFTPYSNLAYSASAPSPTNATASFITSSASVYENTSSYAIGISASVAATLQAATASVSITSSANSASFGTDYVLIYNSTTYSSSAQMPIYISWSAGETGAKYITASISDNTVYTNTSSSISLKLSNSSGVTVGSPSLFSLQILDYEEGYPSFTSASYGTGESSGSVLIYVDRISGSSGPLSVNYSTTNGTAVSGTNYTATTGTFSWADTITTRLSASIPILYDNVQTSDKTFIVSLSGLSTGSFSSYPSAITSSTVTIVDQEPGTFNWSVTSLTAYETGTLATINVSRISGTYGTVTVNVSGSSSLGQDIRTTMTSSLTFTNGIDSQQFTINIQDDLLDQTDDIIYYRLYPTSSTAGATAFTGSSGLLAFTLIDNETGSITFNTGAVSVYENTSSYIFNVQRLYGGDQAETASISYTSTGVENTDYNVIYNGITRASPFNITWTDQDKTTKYITASIYDNQVSGASKTISFNIASSSISSIGPSSSFVLTILDYEEGYPSFTSSSYSIGEASGSILFYVDRVSGSQGLLSVNYSTTNGTAVSGTNYTKTTGTFSWADGVTTRQSASIPILFDGVFGTNKTFSINLSNLSTGSFSSYLSAITSSTVTIIDQEPGTFKLDSSSYSVTEGQNFNITVSRYSGSFNNVTVVVTSSNATAVSGTDYTQVNQSLSFTGSETSKTFSVSTIENITNVTGSLYFNLGISSVSSAYGTSFIGSPSSASVTIIDNETGSIRFTSASYTGSFSSTIIIPVERYIATGNPDFAATASIGVSASSTAVAGVDYTNIFPYIVTWADQVSGTVNISLQTLSADVWSGNKILVLTASGLTNISAGTIMTASILFDAAIIEKSVEPYEKYNNQYVIYDYGNLSSQFRRKVQQVPFALNKKGTGIPRKP